MGQGYDDPLALAEQDQLDRQYLLHEVYAHLTELDPNWTVRIGLLAPWGEGKSTISQWVINTARAEGHVAFTYSPWSAISDTDLTAGLFVRLYEELKTHKVKIKFELKQAGKSLKARASKSAALKKLSDFNSMSQASFGAFQSLLTTSKNDLVGLIDNLPDNQRVIIVIDDIDRVEKSLIPRFLLTLRDVMNIERVSFLLPFDEQVVAHSLEEYGGSKQFGHEFLDKILDYRIHIKPAGRQRVQNLFLRELEEHCPFIDAKSTMSLFRLLPRNPRKLKALIRSLRIYKREGLRHKNGELDWKALILGQMIRNESEQFFREYSSSTFADPIDEDADRTSPWFSIETGNQGEQSYEPEGERISTLLEQGGITCEKVKTRISALCKFLYQSFKIWQMQRIEYAWRIIDRPELITWGEFDNLYEKWKINQDIEAVVHWLAHGSKESDSTTFELVSELIITISQKYHELLDLASQVALQSEHSAKIQEAEKLIILLNQVLYEVDHCDKESYIFSLKNFEAISREFYRWAHFNGNEADKTLRSIEKNFLTQWIEMVNTGGNSASYFEYLKNGSNAEDFNGGKDQIISGISKDLLELLEYSETVGVEELLTHSDGVRTILPYNEGYGLKGHLLRVSSPFWDNLSSTSPAIAILASAAEDSVIQKNAWYYLTLIQRACNEGTQEVSREDAKKLFDTPKLIIAVWEAAIATPLQYRRLMETRKLRDYAIAQGVNAEMLLFPDWLKQGMEKVPVEKQA